MDNESDVDDDDGFNDNLDRIYDSDDLNAAQQDSSDDEDSPGSDGDVEIGIQRPHQKILTKKRLVNSIDKSLDENCYYPHDFGVPETFVGLKKNPNTKKIFWTNKNPPNASCQRACDVLPLISQLLTLLPLVSGFNSINDALQILFPDQMVQLIVEKTNTKIQNVKDDLPAYYNKSDKSTFIRPLDQCEFYTFISLLYVRGLCGQSMHTYRMLFSETVVYPIFGTTMLKHRFLFLCLAMSFDDLEERHRL